MKIGANNLVAYRVGGFAMKLVPAPPSRAWFDQTTHGFANRCLPMHIANQAGWFVLNDRPLRAIWFGGNASDQVIVESEGDPPYAAISHFGHGILTFTMPYLFRTPPGMATLLRGPSNAPKDAIAPLEGLVETDWAVATAAMSWRFTRPNTWIEFAQDEPICMVVPQSIALLERLRPMIRRITDDPETQAQYQAWKQSRDQFNRDVQSRDPKALKQAWQKHYFQGTAPSADTQPPMVATAHRTRLQVREFSSPLSAATPPAPKPRKK